MGKPHADAAAHEGPSRKWGPTQTLQHAVPRPEGQASPADAAAYGAQPEEADGIPAGEEWKL